MKKQLSFYDSLSVLFFSSLGCISCFYLQQCFGLPAYMASILVGFVGSFLPESSLYDSKQSIACVYTGSFAAMSSLALLSHAIDVLMLSLFVAFYFKVISPYFRGFGGKLGSVAFISVVSFVCIKGLL